MASLGKIDSLQYVLSKGKKENVALLHKFVFQYEGDRNSRKRLRNFEGFDFSQDDERFESLQEYVAASFEDNELITICNMLGIDYKADDLFLYIFHNLRKGGLLSSINAVDDTDDESDDDFDDNEDDHKNDTIVQRNEDEDEVNSKTHGNHQYNEDEVKLKSETHCDNQHNDGDDKINRGARNMRQRSMMSQNKTIKNNNELKQSQNQRQKSVENLTVASENIATSRFALNFRDVEDSIRPFSGDDLLSVDVWLNEFEEISTMMQWDDLQKFIFAKRSIKGLARTYIMSERGINNWFKLKNALINEFKESTNSAELHKLMINRKIKKNESLQEYFLNMKELASRGNIEEAALIQYVIDGINDSNINKIILYGAKNLREFKEKLKCYESIFGKDQAVNVKINKKPVEHQGKETKTILCYNCGMKGHVSSNCSNKNKGVKCFNCNKYGHKANECTLKSKSEDVRIIKNNKDDIMLKNIVVGTKTLLSLIDTGSKCHLMTLQTHELLNSRNLQKSHIKLIGFGKSSVTPIGNCYHSVVVDGQSFNLLFHVVPTHLLDVDIIIGQDIVKETDIIIKDNKVTFEKRIQPNQVKGEVDIFNISVSDANTFDIEATVKDVTKNEVEAQTDFLKEANTSSEVSNEVFKDEEVGKSATLLAEEAVHDNNVVNSSENFETKNETKIDKEIKSEEVVNEIKSETADCDEEISENNIEADLNKDILIPNNEPTQVPNNELAEQPNMNNNEFLTKPVEGKVDETIDDSVKKLDAVSEQIAVSEESILPKSNNESAILSPKTVELIKPSTTKENTNKSPENPEQPKIDEIKTNDTDNSLTSPPLNSLSTKTLNQATLPNRKRRLAEFISTRNTRQSISECELEANTENQTEEDFVDDSNDLDVGGKRLKMRPKCLNTELRKIIEAKKVATEETTSSSGEEDSRKNRKIIAPKARLDKTKSPKSPPVNDRNETKTILDQTDTNKVEETSSNIAQVKAEDSVTTVSTVPNPVPPVAVNKQKPTLAEIIEKKLKKAPEVPKITNTETSPLSLEKTSNTFNSPRKSPITKPLKKNLLTQLRQEESDEEAIPRKRTISETVASPVLTESIKLPENASIQVKQEIEEKEKETIVHQKSLDRKTPERQRKRRSSEEIKQNNIPETVKDKLILTENVKIEDVSKEDDEKIEQPKKQKNLEEDKSNISESKKELKKKVTPSPPEPVANRRSSRRGGAAVVYTELSLPKRTRGANLIIKKEDIKNESKDDKVVVEKAVPKTENNSDSNKKTVKKLGAKTNKKDDPILVKKELEMVRSLEMKAAAEQQAGLTQSPAEDNKSSSSRGVRKKREVVDTTNIIESTDAETPVRQSRRIAQQKIKEEAERRKLEEIALRTMKQELKKKKKAEKQADSTVAEPSEQSSSEDECLVELKKKSKKKCPGKDGWSSGSEEQEEPEEEDEEPPHYESDPGSPLFKSDHEFSPESDIEDESQVVPMKRARTARKEDAEDGDIRDEEACQKCGKSDHPEWILLCDNCDKGYHCSCLSPVLFYIPEGDWYCPPCQQEQLIVALEMQLKQFDELVERKKWEEEEEKRLAQEAERAEKERLELEKTRKKSKRSKYHDGESCSSEEANDNEKSDGDRESDEDTKSQGRDNIHKKVKNDNIDTVKRRRGDGRRRRRAAARGARRTRRQRHGSDSATDSDSLSDSASDNESSSDSFSDSDNEPIYKLRKRRQINVSYRLNEFDDLINSALKKEMDEVAGAGNLGRGKDITTILEADKEEKARLKQLEKSNQQVSDRETSEMKEEKKSDEEESLKRKARPKLSLKKKSRKLTTLDISSEEDNASDEDFKTSSFDDEEEEDTSVSVSSNSDSSLEMYKRRNKHSKKKQRKAARRAARERRKVRNFVVEDSDDDEEENRPKSKKKRKDDSDYTESETGDDLSELTENLDSADLCDDTTSEDSDGAWHPSKRKKQRRNTTAIARKSPKLKKQPVKIKKRVEYSDDDITESEEEDEDDDDDVCGGKGSGKQPRSQPLKTNNSNKESNKGKGKGKGKGTTSKKKKKHPSDDESLSDSGDSTRRTRGRRYAYLEDFDDDSSDGGIKPGVKRPDTPPEEREKFIQKQEEIKRMLAEKNAEGAKLAATPRLTPIKAGEEKGKRSPAKPGDSLSTVPLSVIRQAKVLDIDYLQRKGENIGDNDNVAEVEPTFDDVDLPDDLPDDMDEEEIARMVDEEEDFDNATVRELPSAEEVLRTPTKSKSKDTEKLLANPSLAAMSQMPSATSSGLQEPLRKRLPMPTMHPPLLRHQTSHQDLPMGQILQRHPAPSSYLLQNALNTPLGQPLNRSFTQQQFQQIHQHQMQQQQLHQQQMQQQQLQHQQQLQQQRHRQQHQDQQMQHRILHAQFQQIQHQQFKQHLQQQQQMKQQHESAHHMPPIPPGHSSAPSHMMPARPPLPSTQQLSGVTPTTEINTGTATTTTTGTATGTTTGTATGTTTGTTTTAATTVTVTVTATGTASETTAGTTAGATPGTTPGATTATATGTNEIRPRGRRKKITPLRDPIQKQQAAAAVSAANAAALAAKVAKAKEKALEAASQSKDTKPDIHSGASAQQHYKPPGPVIESQSSVITRMPHIPPIPPGRAAAATAGFYSNVDVARFYGPPQQGIPGERQVNSPQRIRPPPTIPGMPPQQGMRPTYGPPLRGGNVQPNHSSASTAAAAAAAAAASGVRLQYTPSQSERHGTPMNIYGTPPPARHASSHLNPYRASIYGNPNFNPRAANIRSGAPAGPEYTGGPRGYPPFGYYPNPPPLTTAPPQTSAPPSTAPHAVSATSSVIVTAPPAASTASTVSVVPPPVPASNSTTLSEKSPITVTTNNKPTPEIVTKPITTLKREASPEPRKKLITLEAYSKESAKSPLAIGGESSGSRSSPGLQPDGAEDSSSAPAAINAPANADANNEGQESEFSGLVSYFSSQHDDYNT